MNTKKLLKVGMFILATILVVIILYSCGSENKLNNDDIIVDGIKFTCLTNTDPYTFIDKTERLYVHDQTGVLYVRLKSTFGGLTALIKPDGTAYTIEDYNRDCKTQ